MKTARIASTVAKPAATARFACQCLPALLWRARGRRLETAAGRRAPDHVVAASGRQMPLPYCAGRVCRFWTRRSAPAVLRALLLIKDRRDVCDENGTWLAFWQRYRGTGVEDMCLPIIDLACAVSPVRCTQPRQTSANHGSRLFYRKHGEFKRQRAAGLRLVLMTSIGPRGFPARSNGRTAARAASSFHSSDYQ